MFRFLFDYEVRKAEARMPTEKRLVVLKGTSRNNWHKKTKSRVGSWSELRRPKSSTLSYMQSTLQADYKR